MAQIHAISFDTHGLSIPDTYEISAAVANNVVSPDSPTFSLTGGAGRTGSHYMRAAGAASNLAGKGTSINGNCFIGALYTTAFCQVAFRVVTLPSVETTIAGLTSYNDVLDDSAWTAQITVTLDASGVLRLYNASHSQITGTISTLWTGANGWNVLEMHVDVTGGSGHCVAEARLNGHTFATSSTETITSVSNVIFGINLLNETSAGAVLDFEDIVWNDATGSVCNSWPGGAHVLILAPVGPGIQNDWGNFTGGSLHAGSSSNFLSVQDPTDGLTFVQSTTNGQVDFYSFGLSLPANVNMASAAMSFRHENDAQSSSIGYRPYMVNTVTATTVRSTTDIIINLSAPGSIGVTNLANSHSNITAPWVFYNDPAGHTWTPQVFNVCNFGMGISLDTSTSFIVVFGVWLTVVYTDPNEFSRAFL